MERPHDRCKAWTGLCRNRKRLCGSGAAHNGRCCCVRSANRKIEVGESGAPKDNWAMGCGNGPVKNPNCPETVGPDFDFSASPILATLASGRQLIVIPQKSGIGYALDPDKEGALVWKYQAGRGSGIGGVWGATVDAQQAYFAVADQRTPAPGGVACGQSRDRASACGTRRLRLRLCGTGPGCSAAQSAALTVDSGCCVFRIRRWRLARLFHEGWRHHLGIQYQQGI